ncbi:MAG: DNA gyrase inhibitor YacG [Betaproteobacteria bacterium]|nr:DNA gyrase inhibitor YacG [Betaproteobacteria bacterium]
MDSKPRVVNCPTCGKAASWTPGNVWRPFCSERCKMIDLGAWADERYRVPVAEDKDQLEVQSPDAAPTDAAGRR